MHTHATIDPNDATFQLGSSAGGLIVPGLIAAAAGGAVAWFCGSNPTLFYHAYLVAFVFYLTITLGGLFFVLLHHLARSGWSVTLRRPAEALSGNVGLLILFFLPVYFNLDKVYVWADTEGPAAESVQKDAGPAHEKSAAAESAAEKDHGAVVGHRAWLTRQAFLGRFVIYFVIWGFLAWYLRGHSILQDRTGNIELTRRMERISAPGMILFAFTITGAAIDLIMSLNQHWFSTMIGVYLFAGTVLNGFVAVTLLALVLQSRGLLRGAVTVEHYHDLGKLTFGFVVFWAYIAFSQYMLIWYANIPEETQFFMPRQIGPWVCVSLALIVVHFVLPFFGLMSRHVKRALPVFTFWLVWLLAAHAYDLFWLIMPNSYIRTLLLDHSAGGSLPDIFKTLLDSQQSVYQLSPAQQGFMEKVAAPLSLASIATVAGLLVFMGGLYVASTALLLSGARLVAVKDPRLDESLSFHNT
jgi:hypothetical protein